MLLSQIYESPVHIRDCDQDSEFFKELCASISRLGVINPVLVRPLGDSKYQLIDGLHRYHAALRLGLIEIPASIRSLTDVEAIEYRLILHSQSTPIKDIKYRVYLQRVLGFRDTSLRELSEAINKSEKWICKILGLNRLSEEAKSLLLKEKIKLTNAYILTKLPMRSQKKLLPAAMRMNSYEFSCKVASILKKGKKCTS